MSEKRTDWMRLLVKYKGKCSECGKEISRGEYAMWSRSLKVIKHLKCETNRAEEPEENDQVPELECFVCGKSAGCAECGFEADCNRSLVSQACICSNCMADKKAYENYQRVFLDKMLRVAKVKI